MVYIILLIVLSCCAFLDYIVIDNDKIVNNLAVASTMKRKIKPRDIIYIILVAVLIIIAGLRYYSGYDFANYSSMYYGSLLGLRFDGVEKSYYYLNRMFNPFTGSPQAVIFTMSLVTLIIKAVILRKASNKYLFGIFIYVTMFYFVYDMGQIRSSLAAAFGAVALYLIAKKKKKIAIIFIILAALFHTSAIILLLALFVRGNKQSVIKLAIIYIVCFLLGRFISLHYIGIFAQNHIGGALGKKIYMYTVSHAFAQKIGISLTLIFDLVVIIIALAVREIYNIKDKYYNMIFNLYFIGVAIYLLFNNYFVIGVRLSNYFKLVLVVFIPMIIGKIPNKRIRALMVMFFIVALALMAYREISGNINIYLPYHMNIFGKII